MIYKLNSPTASIKKTFKPLTLVITSLALLALSLSPLLGSQANAEDCLRGAPSVEHVSPAQAVGSAGKTLLYSVSVTNNDSADCTASGVFIANYVTPGPGWTVDGGSAVNLFPSESAVFNVTVTSPVTAADGPYEIDFYATQVYQPATQEDPGSNAPFTLAYIVQNGAAPDTQAPWVALTSPTSGGQVARGSVVNLEAAASDNVGITQVQFYVNGDLLCSGLSVTCSWHVPKKKNATYNLEVRAYDAAGNVGSSSVVVNAQ